VLTLNLAQHQSLGAVTLTAADIVTLVGSGAALGALPVATIAALAGKGIDRLDATDDVLTLTLAQYQALATVALTAADVVTLAATGSVLAGLSTAALAALAGKGIDRLDASDNVLTLDVAHYLALGPVVCATGDVVVLADTGANLATLSAANMPPWPATASTASMPSTMCLRSAWRRPSPWRGGPDRGRRRDLGRHRRPPRDSCRRRRSPCSPRASTSSMRAIMSWR